VKRKSISKKTRFEVFKRDRFVCQYCGSHPPDVILHVDHIVAVAAGGTNDIDNLVTACSACNIGKGARDLQSAPTALAEKAALVAEAEEQLRGYQEIMEARRRRIEDDVWKIVHIFDEKSESWPRNDFQSVKKFIERLGLDEVIDAAERTMAKKTWYSDYSRFKYFCGVCWGKVRDKDGPKK
jgi:hypothetical protein